jgi:glycerol-3-phosphate dehydrogenase
VLVIGGGATGAGVVRDAAMRGFRAALVERVDPGQGTTGRYHGLLHSGGRYVVSDPEAARECAQEVDILHRIAAEAVEATGGLFVSTEFDDPEYADRFLAGCREHGVGVEEITTGEALRREPRINPRISRAFAVRDGAVDAWKLIWGNLRSAQHYGAEVFPYHWVTRVLKEGDAVTGIEAHDAVRGEDVRIEAAFTINATGVWAGELAEMAGCPGVTVVPGRGIMIAMNHRLVHSVVNRCDHPGDGDILVPIRTVCVIGTTDSKADNPNELAIPADEVQEMLDAGERLVPGFRETRALHVWAGARPLFHDERAKESDTRKMSRGLAIIDHHERDGVTGFLTITGGKATTYRLMAQSVVDAMCEARGERRECRTADETLPGSEHHQPYVLSSRLAAREENLQDDQAVCECELLSRRRLVELLDRRPTATFDDVRRQLRLGMGPCQGGFCSLRVAGIAHELGYADIDRTNTALRTFLEHRWIGLHPILYGDQARQAVLDDWIFQGLLDVEHLPAGASIEASP